MRYIEESLEESKAEATKPKLLGLLLKRCHSLTLLAQVSKAWAK